MDNNDFKEDTLTGKELVDNTTKNEQIVGSVLVGSFTFSD